MSTSYRYRLERGPWMNGEGTVLFVMLNPSTATQTEDDPTIRRCVSFAQTWGFAWLKVGNLYALRATDPRDLFAADDPVGPENDRWLTRLARSATEVIVAWGASSHPEPARARQVLELVESHAGAVRCLGQTQGGHPRHPCRLSSDTRRVPFKRQAVTA